MPRALVRCTFASGTPPATRQLPEGQVLAPFGRWLRERVASALIDWPCVGFHRWEITDDGLELVLTLRPHAPVLASALAIAQPLARELDRAARATGWTREILFAQVSVTLEDPNPGREATPTLRATANIQHWQRVAEGGNNGRGYPAEDIPPPRLRRGAG